MASYSVGFVYVLVNEAMPGIVKVGFTTKLAEERAGQLYSSGVALPFTVAFRAATSHWQAVERHVHSALDEWRVNPRREFFRVTDAQAVEVVRQVLVEVGGIDAWQEEDVYRVRHGDRIAMTTRAEDLFVVVTHPSPVGGRSEITDLWQAHSEGDLLELMGTRDLDRVAGLGDDVPGAETDPVPHLDRKGRVPNGHINGRERLVPGERIVWLRPIKNGTACKIVFFEMFDHCQVVSRTWTPQLNRAGQPWLMNKVTYEEFPPGIVKTAGLLERLGAPRCWAPRRPAHSEEWYQSIGRRPPKPDYWLKQLKPR